MKFTYNGTGTISEGTTILKCTNNVNLLPNLPEGLQKLCCSNTQITSLPSLPASLQILDCSHIQITSLPALPEGLQILWCGGTQITSLPPFFASPRILYCYDTHITSLPALPEGLQTLSCHSTHITSLPALPEGLQTLSCGNTHITSLPEKVRNFLSNQETFKNYNKWLRTIKMSQCMYKKKYLRKLHKKKISIIIANWIYEYGNRPGKVFARLAEKRFNERINKIKN